LAGRKCKRFCVRHDEGKLHQRKGWLDVNALLIILTLLITIAAALGLGVGLGYAAINAILHAMRRQQPVPDHAFAPTEASSGD
jgi:hypothetical protein